MDLPDDVTDREELFELYFELHLSCGRVAATLRLLSNYAGKPDRELMKRLDEEHERAMRLWTRIAELTAS